jgi:hypothetical protein
MPVEIRELQINVTVNQQGDHAAVPAQPGASEIKGDVVRNLVNQSIEEVLEIIHNSRER